VLRSKRIPHTGRLLCAVLLAMGASVYAQKSLSQPDTAEAVLAQIRGVVGDSPAECGRCPPTGPNVPGVRHVRGLVGEKLEASVKCALDAAAQRPFRMLIEYWGVDTFISVGLFGGPDGRVQHFEYEEGGVASLRPGAAPPKVRATPCPAPSVTTHADGAFIACKPN
jgi:hypothetical protein